MTSDLLNDALDKILRESKPRKPHNHLSIEAKEVAGTLAHFQSQESVAELFDVTQPAVSLMERGLKGGTSKEQQRENPELKEKIDSNLDKILNLTTNVALKAVEKIDDAKLDKLNALGLARVAKEMISVGQEIKPKSRGPINSQVVVIAHPGRSLSEYEVIDVPSREIRT